jgi:hypothetical protein
MTQIDKIKKFFRTNSVWIFSIIFLTLLSAIPDVLPFAKVMTAVVFVLALREHYDWRGRVKSKRREK